MSGAAITAAGLSAAAARLGYAALCRRPPGGKRRWARTNHRGEPVTLLEGPALAAGAAAAVLAGGLPGRRTGGPELSPRQRAGIAVAGLGAGAFGCYDDLAGSRDRRGFRGHLGALARGELTSGAVKIAGIGAAAAAAGLLLRASGGPAGPGRPGLAARGGDLVLDTALIAGGANLLNLFDLRPGRAIKVALAAGLPLAAARGRAAAAPLGAAAALLPEDLGERAMLGDAGANALGAMLGAAAALALPRPARAAVLAGVAGLTAASEFVSFTQVIERTPPLRWLDMLGRRPPAVPRPAAPPPVAPQSAAPR